MKLCGMSILALALVLQLGCAQEKQMKTVELVVRVTDDMGAPIDDATVHVNDKSTKKTGPDGRASVFIVGSEGERIVTRVKCPAKYKAVGDDLQIVYLKYVLTTEDQKRSLAPMSVQYQCQPTVRSHVLVVRAVNGQNLPVLVLGKPLGKINGDGVAQMVIEGSAAEEIDVTIDTRQSPQLSPSMPTRRLKLPQQSRFFVFEQKFETEKKETRKKRKRRNRNLPRRL